MTLKPNVNCLFLGDLSVRCTKKDIRAHFKRFGQIEEVDLRIDLTSTKRTAYGFVYFTETEDAETARETMKEGFFLFGRNLRQVEYLTP